MNRDVGKYSGYRVDSGFLYIKSLSTFTLRKRVGTYKEEMLGERKKLRQKTIVATINQL